MRFAGALLSFSAILVTVLTLGSIRAQDKASPGLIQGKVYKSTDHEPMEGVTVSAVTGSKGPYDERMDGSSSEDGAQAYFTECRSRSHNQPFQRRASERFVNLRVEK